MSEKNAEQIKSFYTELAKVAPSQDWERILKTAKKILGLSVNEKKAFQTKIVCLINLDKFDEALTSIERSHDADDLYFEKAYCEYRLNKVNEAYETLLKCEQMTVKEKELMAQVTYRLEKYQESYDFYRDIIKNVDDDFDVERQTNLSAVVASLKSTTTSTKDLDMTENEKKTYELCYNSACISISKGNYMEAQEKLTRAEKMCIKAFEDEQEGPEDQDALEKEIAVIRAQLAFCLQKLGKTEDSLKIYNNILKTRKADVGVNAVISNNLVCINKDQNVFDSKKRIKAATALELEQKLNSLQRGLIAYNEILFCLITNQNDATQKLLKQYELKFGQKERYSLLKMAQLCKEKKYSDAEKLLNDLRAQPCSSIVLFYLTQIYLMQGKVDEAIATIKTMDEFKQYKLGITSALVSLLNSKSLKQEITLIFNNAIEFFSKSNPNAKELEVYIKENSNYQLECGNLPGACEMLEKMRVLKPDDFRILSKLINIYSKFDTDKAKGLSKELPTLEDIMANSNIDIDMLESQFNLLSSKYSKLKTTTTGQIKSPENKAKLNAEELKLKKKKKKKIRLPKNLDPNAVIDQERWIPLRERSYFRGKRNKKKGQLIGKGTQGAVSAKDSQGPPQPTSPKPTSATSPAPADKAAAAAADKPKPKPNVAAQKKKKKGGKW